MDTTDPVRDAIDALIAERGTDWTALARDLGCKNPQQISHNWRHRGVPPYRYEAIAAYFGITVDALLSGKTPPLGPSNHYDISSAREPAETVGLPFVEWKHARERKTVRDPATAYPALARSASANAFWTTAETDAVSNKIPRGAMIVIDPDMPIEHGRYVLVDKAGDLLLRKLSRDGDRWLLVPDTHITPITPEPYNPDTDSIVGTVRQVFIEP